MFKHRTSSNPSRRPRGAKCTLALAVCAGTLLLASASAQAGWSPVYPAKNYHCGGTALAPHTPKVSLQTCVIVADTPTGAYVQGAVKVANQDENTQRQSRPWGGHRLAGQQDLPQRQLREDLAPGWPVHVVLRSDRVRPGAQPAVFATGATWYDGGVQDRHTSAYWKTGQTTAQMRAKIVSILYGEGRQPGAQPRGRHELQLLHRRVVRPGTRVPDWLRSQAWCADFGRWVCRQRARTRRASTPSPSASRQRRKQRHLACGRASPGSSRETQSSSPIMSRSSPRSTPTARSRPSRATPATR